MTDEKGMSRKGTEKKSVKAGNIRKMKSNGKKRGSILVQTGLIFCALFILLILVIMSMVYSGVVSLHLEDKKDKLKSELVRVIDYVGSSENNAWFFDYWENHVEELRAYEPHEIDPPDAVVEYFSRIDVDRVWLDSLSEKDQLAVAYTYYEMVNNSVASEKNLSDYGELFCIDLQENHRGFVFFQYSGLVQTWVEPMVIHGRLGSVIDVDLDDHPVLEDLLSGRDETVEYEKCSDFPVNGDHYLAYKPIYMDGRLRCVVGISYNWSSFSADLSAGIGRMTLISVGAILLIAMILLLYMYRKSIRPLQMIHVGVRDYREEKDSTATVEQMGRVKVNNEFGILAEDISELAVEMDRYTEENIRLNAEQERVATELDMARSIQTSQLPSRFPAFPDRKEFDIYASMIPAREVGGDFYDFFFIDDDHLALVIADVAGKGVPAALFMMMSKILISNYAMMGLSPAEVLRRANNAIFRNNKEHMFVTVWLGIFEVSTGRILAANAGHEYPFLRRTDGEFVKVNDRHGFVLGGMKNMNYEEYEMCLAEGDALVVYTDGITEAKDSMKEMFGTERIEEALNRAPDAGPQQLMENVQNALNEFVGGVEQFDDQTILILKRNHFT